MKLYSIFLLLSFQFLIAFTEKSESLLSSPVVHCSQKPDSHPTVSNLIFQSKDGGQTWHDISFSLPENEQPEDFFAIESTIYLRDKNGIYSSKNNLRSPSWKKESILDTHSSIAFNRSGTIAFNYEGNIYQQQRTTGNWEPAFTNFKKNKILSIVETKDGSVFIGTDNGLYKSADKGESWRHVVNKGWVSYIAESEGVLVGLGQNGIIRSTDNGEHWELVINEGGVGIAIERIHGGFAAIVYNDLYKTRKVYSSMDAGKTWNAIDQGLNPSLSISSIKQVGNYLLCGHPDGIYRSADKGKTWNLVLPNANKSQFRFVNAFSKPVAENGKVLTLYVSGNTVYAVARDAGC